MSIPIQASGCLSVILFGYLLINLFTTALSDKCTSPIPPNTNCTFTIDTSGKNEYGIVHVSGVRLHDSDLFTVQIGNETKNVKFLSNGLIVLPYQPNYIFSVNTSSDDGGRHFQKIESLAQDLAVTELKEFTILLQPNIDKLNPITFSNADDEKSIFLSTANKGVKATSLVKGNPNLIVDLDEKDFLTGDKKFKLEFKNYNETAGNIYHFNLLKASKSCSGDKIVDDLVELKTFDKKTEYTGETYTCVYFLKSNDGKTNLQVDKFDFKTINEYDVIIIKDGQKLTSNDLINAKTKDASSYLNNLQKTLSSSTNLMVILSSNFIPDDYEQSVVTIKKSTIKKLDKEGDFDFIADKETIFVSSLNDKYPVLNFGKNLNLKDTNLSIYYGMDLSTEPVMQFFENEIVNSEIWSEKKTIVLKFTSSSPLAIKGKLTGTPVNCNKLSNRPSTFVLNGSQDITTQSCHFYFKPNDVVHSITLSLENVLLFQSSCLELKGVNEAKIYFKICNENPSKDKLEKIHLPELILPYADSYILTYKEGKNFKGKILVQASFAYNSQPRIKNTTLTKETPTDKLSSYNYPYGYPFVLDKEMNFFNSDKYVYVSFEKYDLNKNDVLNTYPETNLIKFTNRTVDDFIVYSQKTGNANIGFSLISNINLTASLLENEFSQGYLINLERFECNLELNLKDLSIKTPNYPDVFNQSKCIAIIDLSDKKNGQYLNLTIKNAKATNYGHLTIYDSSTRHRSSELAHVFNSTVLEKNETINFNATSTKLVLIYDTLGKSVNGFELKIEKKDCPKDYFTCDDNTRCVLKSIRCNYVQECLDNRDEYGCHFSPVNPIPPPTPTPEVRGMSYWVVVFIIIPLSAIAGAAMILHGPRLLARLRTPRSYQEFNTFSENA